MDINLQSEIRTPSTVNSKENLIPPNRDAVTINISQLEAKPLCRICYSSSENLIRPCECRGIFCILRKSCKLTSAVFSHFLSLFYTDILISMFGYLLSGGYIVNISERVCIEAGMSPIGIFY